MYDVEGEQGCPGEDECQIFQSSAPDQPLEARCPGCPRLEGNAEPEETGEPSQRTFIDQIERLVNERNSGFGFPPDLTQLEKELVMVWDDTVAQIERSIKLRMLTGLQVARAE